MGTDSLLHCVTRLVRNTLQQEFLGKLLIKKHYSGTKDKVTLVYLEIQIWVEYKTLPFVEVSFGEKIAFWHCFLV